MADNLDLRKLSISREETARRLCVSLTKLRQLELDGLLVPLRQGPKHPRYLLEDVNRYLEGKVHETKRKSKIAN